MRALPRGTVTLLFTDIEGSTRLLHELGRDRYVQALEHHRRLLRASFSHNGGVEVEAQGDSFFFAFPYARDAVAAAADAQRVLAAQEWEGWWSVFGWGSIPASPPSRTASTPGSTSTARLA